MGFDFNAFELFMKRGVRVGGDGRSFIVEAVLVLVFSVGSSVQYRRKGAQVLRSYFTTARDLLNGF